MVSTLNWNIETQGQSLDPQRNCPDIQTDSVEIQSGGPQYVTDQLSGTEKLNVNAKKMITSVAKLPVAGSWDIINFFFMKQQITKNK